MADKEVIQRDSLALRKDWQKLGHGGFGSVYKVRHEDYGYDVAVKILRQNQSDATLREARFMDLAACEHVVRLYGLFEDRSGERVERGLVMQYMKRGSVESMKTHLSDPQNFALSFRLAHDTALAMNFLHRKNIVHRDLKPSNVLLSDDLRARLADFGLSTRSHSVVFSGGESDTQCQGGTYKYMPPEFLSDLSREPVRSYDVYSFGILLWWIFSEKELYPDRDFSMVRCNICDGERPGYKDLLKLKVDGIKDLVELMKSCWDQDPHERPHFKDIHKTTESLLRNDTETQRAADAVRVKLDSPNQTQQSSFHRGAQRNDEVDHRAEEEEAQQASSGGDSGRILSREEKVRFVDSQRKVLIQEVSHVLEIVEELGNMVPREIYKSIKAKEKSTDQVRVIYDNLLWSGGARVKEAFYDALKKHERKLMKKLGTDDYHGPKSVIHVQSTAIFV